VSRNRKLFRAIVVMGAAVTAPACGEDVPKPDAQTDAVAAQDAPADGPKDAGVADVPVDVVLIL
jgi:hypothetical protein